MTSRLRALKNRQSVIESYERARSAQEMPEAREALEDFEEKMKKDVAALKASWQRKRTRQICERSKRPVGKTIIVAA